MKVVELFAGVGGFRLGLERAGHEVVYANEWDRFACDVYDKNFINGGFLIDRQDIRTVDASDIPAHDLLVGGFPCQAFSVAGKRAGFSDTRGTLFFEIARIAAYHRTPYLLLENVKGLLSHDEGRTFGTILQTLDDMGYDCQWQVLNSKDFGVPQNRERVIIVGNLRDRPRPEVFPLVGASGEDLGEESGSESAVAPSLRSHQGGVDLDDQLIGIINRGEFKDTGGRALTITASYYKGADNHGQRPMVKVSQGSRLTDVQGVAPTLSSTDGGGSAGKPMIVVEGQSIRRLTPIECERLQGFPDNWTAGVSDTQRYKQMGNAVTTNVIEAVAMHLPH